MQKLLRITPSGPSSATTHGLLSPLGFKFNHIIFLSRGFRSFSMAATFHLRPSASGTAVTVARITRNISIGSSSCRICRCPMESAKVPLRTWIGLKESRLGSPTLFCTDSRVSDKGVLVAVATTKNSESGGESVGGKENDLEKSAVRLNK